MTVNDFDVTGSYSDPGSLLAKVSKDFEFIPIGQTRRSARPCMSPAQVKCANDLPERLFLGALDCQSFQASKIGWSVRYVDTDPRTFADVSYSSEKNQLVIRHVWRGIQGAISHTLGSWREATRYGAIFPAEWYRHLCAHVCHDYNVRVAEDASDASFQYVHNFPEGFWTTLLCPIPARRLVDLVAFLDRLDSDTDVAGQVLIYVVKTPSIIEYVGDRCHDVPMEPVQAAAYSRRCSGLPTLGLPQRVNLAGISILRVHRLIYIAHIICSLRDLDRVLAHGKRLGFLSSNVGDKHLSEYPYGVEWTWYSMPGKLTHRSCQIRVYDNLPSRQVKYWNLLPPRFDSLIKATETIGRKTALGVAAFAMVSALAEPDDLLPASMDKGEAVNAIL